MMPKNRRVILDLCGGTGSWSEPYRLAGYNVQLVTLPDKDVSTYEPPASVHGILAAPPCTHFSLARTTAKTPRDFKTAFAVVQACLNIIWTCRLQGGLKWWALENPLGYLRQFLGCPPFVFNPYDFGDAWTKPTDLWGYYHRPEFNFRRPECGVEAAEFRLRAVANSLTLRRPEVKLTTSDALAVTPPGFARAFFKANP